MRYEVEHLRGNRYVIRPRGTLGTCGWINGEAWQAFFITARNAGEAMLKFHVSHRGKDPIVERR